jgi:hypothetical protein
MLLSRAQKAEVRSCERQVRRQSSRTPATACLVFRNAEPVGVVRACARFPMIAKRTNLSSFVQFNNQIGDQLTANLGEKIMVKRAITTLGGGDPASASFHRCAAIRESQRRYRANHFVDGGTESLTTTDLSRISGSFVVRRHTAFTHKSDSFHLKKIKRKSTVPCVLEGSVQRGGKRLRVSVPFVGAESGRHLSKI